MLKTVLADNVCRSLMFHVRLWAVKTHVVCN